MEVEIMYNNENAQNISHNENTEFVYAKRTIMHSYINIITTLMEK